MPNPKRDPRLVAALVYDGLCTFEFGVVAEVFGLSRPEMGAEWYRFITCSERRGPQRASGRVWVSAEAGLSGFDRAGTIVIPGWRSEDSAPSPQLRKALLKAHQDGARLVSICSGAFLLAELGILNGRQATTHWRYAEQFRRHFPLVDLAPEVLYIDGGDFLTSAGSAAGIDLLLHIVRKDFGPEAANLVARRLVMPPHRDGGQLQFISAPVPLLRDSKLSKLLEEIRSRPAHRWTLTEMSNHAAMSVRTLCRKFAQTTGANPGEWLIDARMIAAKAILETSLAPLPDIAQSAGFGSVENFVRQFRRRVGVTPSAYRRSFGQSAHQVGLPKQARMSAANS